MIGCGYITLQTLLHLIRHLGKGLDSPILIKLMYAKTQSVSQAYQWYTCWASLWKKKKKKLELYSPGGICHLCKDKWEELQQCSCKVALKCGSYCEECQLDMQGLETCRFRAAVYDLLRTAIVGGQVQVFTRCHEKDITRVRSHVYGEKSKLAKGTINYDVNALYLYRSGDAMFCGKDTLVANKIKNKLPNFQRVFWKRKFLGSRRLILKYPTNFMISLARYTWRNENL